MYLEPSRRRGPVRAAGVDEQGGIGLRPPERRRLGEHRRRRGRTIIAHFCGGVLHLKPPATRPSWTTLTGGSRSRALVDSDGRCGADGTRICAPSWREGADPERRQLIRRACASASVFCPIGKRILIAAARIRTAHLGRGSSSAWGRRPGCCRRALRHQRFTGDSGVRAPEPWPRRYP